MIVEAVALDRELDAPVGKARAKASSNPSSLYLGLKLASSELFLLVINLSIPGISLSLWLSFFSQKTC